MPFFAPLVNKDFAGTLEEVPGPDPVLLQAPGRPLICPNACFSSLPVFYAGRLLFSFCYRYSLVSKFLLTWFGWVILTIKALY